MKHESSRPAAAAAKRARIGSETAAASGDDSTFAAAPGTEASRHGRHQARGSNSKQSLPLPILTKDGRLLLMDIEGTISCQEYARQYLKEYVLAKLPDYLNRMTADEIEKTFNALLVDINSLPSDHLARREFMRSSILNALVARPAQSTSSDTRVGGHDNQEHQQTRKGMVESVFQILLNHGVQKDGILTLYGKIWREGTSCSDD